MIATQQGFESGSHLTKGLKAAKRGGGMEPVNMVAGLFQDFVRESRTQAVEVLLEIIPGQEESASS